MEAQEPQIAEATLSKMSNARGTMIPYFKLYFRAIAIKTSWYGTKTDMKIHGMQ
jgi:hypothetical protein